MTTHPTLCANCSQPIVKRTSDGTWQHTRNDNPAINPAFCGYTASRIATAVAEPALTSTCRHCHGAIWRINLDDRSIEPGRSWWYHRSSRLAQCSSAWEGSRPIGARTMATPVLPIEDRPTHRGYPEGGTPEWVTDPDWPALPAMTQQILRAFMLPGRFGKGVYGLSVESEESNARWLKERLAWLRTVVPSARIITGWMGDPPTAQEMTEANVRFPTLRELMDQSLIPYDVIRAKGTHVADPIMGDPATKTSTIECEHCDGFIYRPPMESFWLHVATDSKWCGPESDDLRMAMPSAKTYATAPSEWFAGEVSPPNVMSEEEIRHPLIFDGKDVAMGPVTEITDPAITPPEERERIRKHIEENIAPIFLRSTPNPDGFFERLTEGGIKRGRFDVVMAKVAPVMSVGSRWYHPGIERHATVVGINPETHRVDLQVVTTEGITDPSPWEGPPFPRGWTRVLDCANCSDSVMEIKVIDMEWVHIFRDGTTEKRCSPSHLALGPDSRDNTARPSRKSLRQIMSPEDYCAREHGEGPISTCRHCGQTIHQTPKGRWFDCPSDHLACLGNARGPHVPQEDTDMPDTPEKLPDLTPEEEVRLEAIGDKLRRREILTREDAAPEPGFLELLQNLVDEHDETTMGSEAHIVTMRAIVDAVRDALPAKWDGGLTYLRTQTMTREEVEEKLAAATEGKRVPVRFFRIAQAPEITSVPKDEGVAILEALMDLAQYGPESLQGRDVSGKAMRKAFMVSATRLAERAERYLRGDDHTQAEIRMTADLQAPGVMRSKLMGCDIATEGDMDQGYCYTHQQFHKASDRLKRDLVSEEAQVARCDARDLDLAVIYDLAVIASHEDEDPARASVAATVALLCLRAAEHDARTERVLVDLQERIREKLPLLEDMAEKVDPDNEDRDLQWPMEFARLSGKCDGMATAASYVTEAINKERAR